MFEGFSNDVIGRSAFGRKLSDSENGKKFLDAMADLVELLGMINIGDFITWLGWVGRVNGVDKRLEETAEKIDQVIESVIKEWLHEKGVKEQSGQHFLEILLDISKDVSIDRDSLKAIILLLLADLVWKFNWKLANGVEPKDLDMRESPGMTVHRAVPLLALASPAT
ncbi:hypothetical protein SASPL_134108 [Salvia splendens]|uniref:Uncharacterized protein n=1 Tax=Salvia splendens TaxID=180675 RepID=A0A8X8X5H2_SALSN|nr:hypothetical protein SASPL_134108 [Salvia splendens]